MLKLKALIENCEHATPTGVVKLSGLCGRRGSRVKVYDCAFYNCKTTREIYKPYQKEMYCTRCDLIHDKIGAAK